jgi:hypothetical protein
VSEFVITCRCGQISWTRWSGKKSAPCWRNRSVSNRNTSAAYKPLMETTRTWLPSRLRLLKCEKESRV